MNRLKLNSAVNANLQNTINTSLILNYVRNSGPTYRAEISKALKLSLPAVSRSVDHLVKHQYFNEKKIITKQGRQAYEVNINSYLGLSIGISIELPYLKMAMMDMVGKVMHLETLKLELETEEVPKIIFRHIKEYLLKNIKNGIPIIAFSIGVPSAVDLVNGKIYAALYKKLNELEIKRLIEEEYKVPVFIENNENLSIFAEKYYHNTIEEENFVFIVVHYGIGAGIFCHGQLYRGANGAAGEIGHQQTPNGYAESLNAQSFEATGSIQQIALIALNLINAGKGEDIFQTASYSYENITHTLIGKLANQGNLTAQNILKEYAELLATGIGNLLVTLNPQLVVFGGKLLDIPNCTKFILEPMQEYLKKIVPFPLPKFRMTRLGNEAGVIGACQMGLENTLLQAFPYNI